MFQGLAPAPEDLSAVQYLFTDIDDTLTTEGRLLPQTYKALWDLSEAGIRIVPVTGGSAGWWTSRRSRAARSTRALPRSSESRTATS